MRPASVAWTTVGALALTLFAGPLGAVGPDVGAAPSNEVVHRTPFTAKDDFRLDPSLLGNSRLVELLLRTIECPGHEPTGDILQPCPPGSPTRVRGLPFLSVVEADTAAFTGYIVGTASGDLEPDYGGRVWGLWTLRLSSRDGAWTGLWYGTRTYHAPARGDEGGAWLTEIHLTGFGTGSLSGRRVRATESVVTYTPLPFPYEVLEYLQLPGPCVNGVCPPEGIVEGRILEPLP